MIPNNNGFGPIPQQPKIHIDINKLPDVICPKCQNMYFDQKIKIKEVSPIISGEKQVQYLPIPVILCSKCGEELVYSSIV